MKLLPPIYWIIRSLIDWTVFLPRWVWDHLSDRLGYYAADSTHPAKYMSQHSLAFACDAHGGAPYVMWGIEGKPWLQDLSTYDRLAYGDSAWVRIEDLARFNREVLPRIKERFVLVTAESDYTVPSDFAEAAKTIAESGKLIRWFATNYDGTAHASLISALPLGMNYRKKHDLHWTKRDVGWRLLRRKRETVPQQEARWEEIAARAAPIEQRLPLAYADFWLNNSSQSRRYGESRADITAQLRDNPCVVFPPHLVNHQDLFTAYTRHAFVISPHGRGLDCYRTWEALFAGCIVIVKQSPIDGLYRDLPVVIVADWSEITPENLTRWIARFGSNFDREPLRRVLSLAPWVEQIRASAVADGATK